MAIVSRRKNRLDLELWETSGTTRVKSVRRVTWRNKHRSFTENVDHSMMVPRDYGAREPGRVWEFQNKDLWSDPQIYPVTIRILWLFVSCPSENYRGRSISIFLKLVNTKIFFKKKTHLVTSLLVKRPRRKFMKQEIANCMKFRKGLTKYSYNDELHTWKLDSKYVIAEEN